MPYLHLLGAVLSVAFVNIFASFYSRKNEDKKDATKLYNLVYSICVFLVWATMYAINPSFEAGVLLYSLGFGAFYTMGCVGLVYALKTGPVALTSLMVKLSLIGVAAWGFFFWDAKFKPVIAVGVAFVVLAIWLCLYKKKEEETPKKSLRWAFFTVLAFVGNAGCTIVQRTQQTAFNGQHGNMLMAFATAFTMLVCLFLYLRSDKSATKVVLKSASAVYPIVGGVSNVLLNVFVMLMATSTLSPSLIYPVIAVGGLAIVALFSLFVFKEKMTRLQWLGIGVGAVAVALLSL